jgi:hypothetical protein
VQPAGNVTDALCTRCSLDPGVNDGRIGDYMVRLVVAIGAALGIAVISTVALRSGIDEARLATSGKLREVKIEDLTHERGFLAVSGCIRHELALGVTTAGHVFRLGSEAFDPEAHDRVFTPLSAYDDCDESKPPKKIYALVEDDESLGTTITFAFQQQVAPPPVPVIVNGVVGYGVGRSSLADAARGYYRSKLRLPLDEQPLFVKGRRPGVLWVALLTGAVGLHGYLVCVLGIWWLVRRYRRKQAILTGKISEAEEEFFKSETIE